MSLFDLLQRAEAILKKWVNDQPGNAELPTPLFICPGTRSMMLSRRRASPKAGIRFKRSWLK
jgi:hypothetical protein